MILIVVFVAIPVAAIAFIANAGNAFRQIGKGGLSVEFESDLGRRGCATPAPRRARRGARGRAPPDARGEGLPPERPRRDAARRRRPSSSGCSPSSGAAPSPSDPALREEVRQLVVARNERRARQGKEPLDVEAEVERQLRELENLGQ